MKVILLKDVKSLGRAGSVVDVSDGHARNFLFPQNAAVQATEEELRRKAKKEATEARREKNELSSAGKTAQQLEGFELIISEKTNDEGVLYAAISSEKIAQALKKAGFNVKAEMVSFSEPIKETGQHEVKIDLSHGFEASIQVVVESV